MKPMNRFIRQATIAGMALAGSSLACDPRNFAAVAEG
jgi:hypothetical protein